MANQVPSSPTNVKGTAGKTPTSIVVEWKPSNGGEGITAYIVEYCEASVSDFEHNQEVDGNTFSVTLQGLNRATKYKVRVVAENAKGENACSDEVEVSTEAKVPDAPKILEIKPGPEPESYTSIFVRWSDDTKSYDRGSPITGFVVEYRNTTDLAEVVRTRVGGGVFSKTLKGLKPSCIYNVSVSAKNAVGSSEPSTRSAGPLIGVKELAADLDSEATNWNTLGLQLDVNVDNIDNNTNRAAVCFQKTLQEWRKSGNAKPEAIIEALRSPTMNHHALAKQLDKPEFTRELLKPADLLDVLQPIAAEWHAFGIQLGVDPNILNQFTTYDSFVRRYLEIVLERWLQKTPPPTIQDIITALRKPSFRNNRLASKLEEQYKDVKDIPLK